MSTIVVFVEQTASGVRRASLEALGAAAATGQDVVAVAAGAGADSVAEELGKHGAKKVVVFADDGKNSPDRTAAAVASVVQSESAGACIAAASSTGKDLMPRIAAGVDCVSFTDCIGFEWNGSAFQAVRPMLAGKAIATVTSSGPVFCATLRPNVFSIHEAGGSAEVSQGTWPANAHAEVVEIAAKGSGKLDVQEAPVVVSGGRGLKEAEHFNIVEGLAAAFGNAATGASRAVVDAGWRPHSEQVGQTGKTVAPQLYIAIGISGAIQHLAGMRTSKVIVAINKDADAPIFKVADYGIVGDAFEVVPALTEAVKAIKAQS